MTQAKPWTPEVGYVLSCARRDVCRIKLGVGSGTAVPALSHPLPSGLRCRALFRGAAHLRACAARGALRTGGHRWSASAPLRARFFGARRPGSAWCCVAPPCGGERKDHAAAVIQRKLKDLDRNATPATARARTLSHSAFQASSMGPYRRQPMRKSQVQGRGRGPGGAGIRFGFHPSNQIPEEHGSTPNTASPRRRALWST